jgi:DASH complex subunit DAD4
LNEAILVMNKTLQVSYYLELSMVSLTRFQEINKQNMNIELVAQMFKNYQSNVLFHLEGELCVMAAT